MFFISSRATSPALAVTMMPVVATEHCEKKKVDMVKVWAQVAQRGSCAGKESHGNNARKKKKTMHSQIKTGIEGSCGG